MTLTGQAVHFPILQVDKHVMTGLHTVCVRMRVLPSPTEELSTHETTVHVVVGQRDGADLFKIKVKQGAIDRVCKHTRMQVFHLYSILVQPFTDRGTKAILEKIYCAEVEGRE